ncbi:MAG: aminoacyl-tRNA deacylase, partial [Candidatus Bathyarchaeia archaeon]
MSRERLEAYILDNRIDARILVFDKPTRTVEDAEKQLRVSRERIVKSMLFVDEKGVPALAIVSGDRKVSEEKLARACSAAKFRVARPRAVKSLTGYEAGALPPIGHKKRIRTFIDPKVLGFEKVYGGGGAINA